MDLLIRLGVGLIVAVFQMIYRVFKTPIWKRQWAAAARQLGYEADGFTLAGTHDGVLSVAVTKLKVSGSGASSLVTLVAVSGPVIPDDLTIGPESFFSRKSKDQDIQIGHKPTDDALRIQGDEAAALAVLGASTRDAILKGVKKHVWIIQSGVCLHRAGGVLNTKRLVAFVNEALAFVARFRTDAHTVDERLRDNAMSDPEAAVRLRNLEVLAERAPRSASCRRLAHEAAAHALQDPNAVNRLVAAFVVGDVQALDAACEAADSRARAQALDTLLIRGLDTDGARRGLAMLAAQPLDLPNETAERLAAHLQGVAVQGRQAALITLLDHKSDRVKGRAAAALGSTADLSAVEPLYEHANKLFGGVLKRQAREAISQIQARMGASGERGGLSLAATPQQAGGLSLGDEGALELAADGDKPGAG